MTGVRRAEPSVARKVYLPPRLAGKIDLLLIDEMRRKPRYGAFSHLVTKLLNEYLNNIEKGLKP